MLLHYKTNSYHPNKYTNVAHWRVQALEYVAQYVAHWRVQALEYVAQYVAHWRVQALEYVAQYVAHWRVQALEYVAQYVAHWRVQALETPNAVVTILVKNHPDTICCNGHDSAVKCTIATFTCSADDRTLFGSDKH